MNTLILVHELSTHCWHIRSCDAAVFVMSNIIQFSFSSFFMMEYLYLCGICSFFFGLKVVASSFFVLLGVFTFPIADLFCIITVLSILIFLLFFLQLFVSFLIDLICTLLFFSCTIYNYWCGIVPQFLLEIIYYTPYFS